MPQAPLRFETAFCKLPISRTQYLGNPSLYDTFCDESLNLALRSCAERSHRSTLERSVYQCFSIMGTLKVNPHLFAREHWDLDSDSESSDGGHDGDEPPSGASDDERPFGIASQPILLEVHEISCSAERRQPSHETLACCVLQTPINLSRPRDHEADRARPGAAEAEQDERGGHIAREHQ